VSNEKRTINNEKGYDENKESGTHGLNNILMRYTKKGAYKNVKI